MSANNSVITVSNIPVKVVRKDIKNLHLSVCPPEGNVRLSVPTHTTDDNVRLAVVSRLGWIKKQQASFRKQARQTERVFVSGESHYFQGRRYILNVVECHGKHTVTLKNNSIMELRVRPGTPIDKRALAINNWYRENLKQAIPKLLEKWEPKIGKTAETWGVKKMKTKWGSCNTSAQRIWLNLELAKKSPECLEYILVHELVHLHERHHNERFKSLMDKFLPTWRLSRDILKSEPLAHEDWIY